MWRYKWATREAINRMTNNTHGDSKKRDTKWSTSTTQETKDLSIWHKGIKHCLIIWGVGIEIFYRKNFSSNFSNVKKKIHQQLWISQTGKKMFDKAQFFVKKLLLRFVVKQILPRHSLVRDSSAVRRVFVRLAGAVWRQSALHKENSGFAAPTLGRHISTFRGYRILFSIRNPSMNRFTNHFSIHS